MGQYFALYAGCNYGVVGLMRDTNGPIIIFDAMCVLCSANAQFILTHDYKRHFRLASMQNDVGAGLYRAHGIDPANPESLVIIDGDTLIRDSDTVLAIYAGLGWPWRMLAIFRIVPHFIRDPVYRWIARNRYRIFGKRETCWLPLPQQAERVL